MYKVDAIGGEYAHPSPYGSRERASRRERLLRRRAVARDSKRRSRPRDELLPLEWMRRVDVAMLLIFSAVEAATARLTVFFIIVPSHVQYHVLCRRRRPRPRLQRLPCRQVHRHEDPNVQTIVNEAQTDHDGKHDYHVRIDHALTFMSLLGKLDLT